MKTGGATKNVEDLKTGDYVQLGGQISVFEQFDQLNTVDNTDIRRPIGPAPTPRPTGCLISEVKLDFVQRQIKRPTSQLYAELARDVCYNVAKSGTVVLKAPMGFGKSTYLMYPLQKKVNEPIYITLPTRIGAQNLY